MNLDTRLASLQGNFSHHKDLFCSFATVVLKTLWKLDLISGNYLLMHLGHPFSLDYSSVILILI